MKAFSIISILLVADSIRYGSCGASTFLSTTTVPTSTSASGISPSLYCPIAVKLSTCGLPKDKLAQWTCVVYYTSRGDSSLKSTINRVNHYGMFQFRAGSWCSETSRPGGGCNAKCSDFLNSELNDDCACALTLFNTPRGNPRGFNHWNFWSNACNTKPLPELSACGL